MAEFGGQHPHHLSASIEDGPSAVAGVDCRIYLKDPLDALRSHRRNPTTGNGHFPEAERKSNGDDFLIECPTDSGRKLTLQQIATELSGRLSALFLRDAHGRRPVFGNRQQPQSDPHWRENVLFYEYFHGDTGAGLGASHQTGWTALVAQLLQQSGARGFE